MANVNKCQMTEASRSPFDLMRMHVEALYVYDDDRHMVAVNVNSYSINSAYFLADSRFAIGANMA